MIVLKTGNILKSKTVFLRNITGSSSTLETSSLDTKPILGAFTYINAKYGVLGDFVQVGSHCAIYSVSTIDNKSGPVVLEKNAKIGSHSTIIPGVTIGENAVVGAHSFVNRDVPAGTIVAGVPPRKI